MATRERGASDSPNVGRATRSHSRRTGAPSYSELLRTVGALLDTAGSQLALIELTRRRVRVLAVGAFGEQELSLRYLRHCIAAQRRLRGRLPPRDPTDLSRLSPVLRAVGGELDRQERRAYRVAVAPGAVIITGSQGYRRTLALDALAALLRAALALRLAPATPSATPGPSHPPIGG